MNNTRHYIITGLMALIVSPLVASFVGLVGLIIGSSASMPLIILICAAMAGLTLFCIWRAYSRRASFPEKAPEIIFPILLVFWFYMCVWIVLFGMSSYRFDEFTTEFYLLTLPYFIATAILGLHGIGYNYFPIMNTYLTAVIVITVILTRKAYGHKLFFDRKIIVYAMVSLCLVGIATFQHFDRNTKILTRIDYSAEQVREDVNLWAYHPFSDGNKLERLDEPPTITIHENYPRLDGATAAYPVYAAIVQELYKDLPQTLVSNYVNSTTTAVAYERLINGEIDIFFGAQPSEQQMQAAKARGVELALTPIAREAFVFFVSIDNPVDSLTIEQIQDIYQKRLTNWREVGGKNEKIMSFQRSENSGSQTTMQAMVMRGTPMPDPVWEEFAGGMGGMISQVAEYRNYSSAIGYSFRYFATVMNPNSNIKLLSIDGIPPTVDNIRTREYPFTVDVYAVTAGSTNENTEKLIQWIISEQGQGFIEKCGYVRTNSRTNFP